MNTYAISDNTYPVRDQLRQIGCKWDAAERRWTCTDEQREAVKAIKVARGGAEELWEPCERCGAEPVDGSGLCENCRGTSRLTLTAIRSIDDEAAQIAANPSELTGWTNMKSSVRLDSVPGGLRVVSDINGPIYGGISYRLFSDGTYLYIHTLLHDENSTTYWHRIDKSALKPLGQRVYDILVSRVEVD